MHCNKSDLHLKNNDEACSKFSRYLKRKNNLSKTDTPKIYRRNQIPNEFFLICTSRLANWEYTNSQNQPIFSSPENKLFNFSRDFPTNSNCTHLIVTCEFLWKLFTDDVGTSRYSQCYNFLQYVKRFAERLRPDMKLILGLIGHFNKVDKEINKITQSRQSSSTFIEKSALFANKIGYDGIFIQYGLLNDPLLKDPSGIIVKNWQSKIQISNQKRRISNLCDSVREVKLKNENLIYILGIDLFDYSAFNSFSKLKHFDFVVIKWNSGLEAIKEEDKNIGGLSIKRMIEQSGNARVPIVISIDFFGFIEYRTHDQKIPNINELHIMTKLSMQTCNMDIHARTDDWNEQQWVGGRYKEVSYYWVSFVKNIDYLL